MRVAITPADPRAPECVELLDEMAAFTAETYPEDAALGIVPPTLDDLAAGVFFLACLDDRPVGAAAGLPHSPIDGAPAMEVKRMYVRAEARGLRIAERLLEAVEAAGRERGARLLALLCGPRQPAALRLYERCGFVRRGPFGAYVDDPLCIYFSKAIQARQRPPD